MLRQLIVFSKVLGQGNANHLARLKTEAVVEHGLDGRDVAMEGLLVGMWLERFSHSLNAGGAHHHLRGEGECCEEADEGEPHADSIMTSWLRFTVVT